MAGMPPLPPGAVPNEPALPAGAVPNAPPQAVTPPLPPGAVPNTQAPAPAPLDTSRPALSFAHFKSKYAQDLDAAAAKVGIDPKMLRAVHFVEDASEDPNIISKAGAIGLMQLEPGTFAQFAAKGANITDPKTNIDAGALALSHYLHKYNGDVDRALEAYNAGEGAADRRADVPGVSDYIARYHQIYASLTQDNTGPGHAPPALSKGGAQPPDTRVAQAVPKQAMTGGVAPVHGEIKPAPGGIMGMLEYAGNALNKSIEGAEANVKEAFAPTTGEQQMLDQYGSLPPVKAAATGTRVFTGATLGLPLDTLDALMRDVATGNTEHIGDIGSRVMGMLKDPLHAGQMLDDMTEQYGPGLRAENLWWAQQPGIRERIAKGLPATPQGQALQMVLGLRADQGRNLLNKSALSGGLGFLIGMIAPVGPEMALLRGGGKLAANVAERAVLKPLARAAVVAAPQTAVKVGARMADFAAHVDAITGRGLSEAPIVGDRYYKVAKEFGVVGENAQSTYVGAQANARAHATMLLGQEDKYGGSSARGRGNVPGRIDIVKEHDKLFNANTTMHTFQPQGGDPIHNNTLGVTVMTKGPAWNEPGNPQVSTRQIVYADHPSPNLPGESVSKQFPGSPQTRIRRAANLIFSHTDPATGEHFPANPVYVEQYNKFIQMGAVRGALRMVIPGIPGQQIEDAANLIHSEAAKLPQAARPQYIREQVEQMSLGHWAQANGHSAVEYKTLAGTKPVTRVVMPREIKAMAPDDRLIGKVSVHDRAVNIAHVFDASDRAEATLAPSTARNHIPGYHPRNGMFAGEMSSLERIAGPDATLEKAKGGGPGAAPTTPKRQYGSIRHALARGEVEDPQYDPAVSAEASLKKSLQFQNYMRYVLDSAKETTRKEVVDGNIDYDATVANAIASGRLRAPRLGGVPTLGKGPAGRKAFEAFIKHEADDDLVHGPDALSAHERNLLPEKTKLEGAAKARERLFKGVQEQFETEHPDLIFRADQVLGVPDLAGLTVPKVISEAAIDGHPVLASKAGMVGQPGWSLRDGPENIWLDGFESLNNMMRSSYMSNVAYHPFRNLARLAFGFGHLTPLEVSQALFMPHTIPDAVMDEARDWDALAHEFHPGVGGRKASARYTYSTPIKNTKPQNPRDIIKERGAPFGVGAAVDALTPSGRAKLGSSIRTMLDGYANVASDSFHGPLPPLNSAMHVLGKAQYTADKWNLDWTFGVGENALAALSYRKLRDIGLKKGLAPDEARAAAARAVRKFAGDSGNISATERKIGVQRMSWYYGWTRGQWRLWSKIMSDPRTAQFFLAQTYGTRAWNEAQPIPDPQKHPEDIVFGYDGDKPLSIRVGGGYLSKAEGIADLATAPFTGGQGLLDFFGAIKEDATNTLSPPMRTVFINMPQSFGFVKGQEPSWYGPLFDTDSPVESIPGQVAGQMGQNSAPGGSAAIAKAMQERDPIYLLDLLGMPAQYLGEKRTASFLLSEENRLRNNLHRALGLTKDLNQQQRIKEMYWNGVPQEPPPPGSVQITDPAYGRQGWRWPDGSEHFDPLGLRAIEQLRAKLLPGG